MADLKTTMDIVFWNDETQLLFEKYKTSLRFENDKTQLLFGGDKTQLDWKTNKDILLRAALEQQEAEPAIQNYSNKRFQELDIQARYGQLPELLSLEAIAYLMGEPVEPFVQFMKKTGLKYEIKKATKAYGAFETGLMLTGSLGDFFSNKTDVKNWLQSMCKWPIDGPLANWWKEDKPEPHANPATDEVQNSKRKKLIPLERETTESLLLIYRIAESRGIEFLDQLPAPKAWGLIVSGKFTDDLIKKHPINDKGELVLNSGETLSKKGFTDKYRSRFKAQT